MLKLFTILFVAIAAATAYDFEDADFNQYLLEDFQSMSSHLLSRQRRDAAETPTEETDKGHHCGGGHQMDWKKHFTCCETMKPDPSAFETIKEAKKECAMKLRGNNPDVENFDPFNCESMEKIKELIFCETECVGKTLGHIGEDGDLQLDSIKEHLRKQFSDADEKTHEQIESYLAKCVSQMKEMNLKQEGKCNRTPMEMHHCMFAEMLKGCPAEAQIQNYHCDRMRENASNSDRKSFGRHLLHELLHHGKHHGGGGHHHGKE